MNFEQLCREVLELIDEGRPFFELFPLLKALEQRRVSEYGPRPWPGCLVTLDSESEEIVIATEHPSLREYHDARFPLCQELSTEDNAELVLHIQQVLRAWLRHIARPPADDPDPPAEPQVDKYDAKLRQALKLWNSDVSVSWADVNKSLGRDPNQKNATAKEIRTYAEKNGLYRMEKTPGAKRKSESN